MKSLETDTVLCWNPFKIPFETFAIFTKEICVGVAFLINNFKATLLKKRLQHRCFLEKTAEFLRSPFLKNIFERLLLSYAISKWATLSNLGFPQPIILKFLCQNENIKIVSKIVKFKENILQFSHIMFIWYFTTNSRDFNKILKLKIFVFKPVHS